VYGGETLFAYRKLRVTALADQYNVAVPVMSLDNIPGSTTDTVRYR